MDSPVSEDIGRRGEILDPELCFGFPTGSEGNWRKLWTIPLRARHAEHFAPSGVSNLSVGIGLFDASDCVALVINHFYCIIFPLIMHPDLLQQTFVLIAISYPYKVSWMRAETLFSLWHCRPSQVPGWCVITDGLNELGSEWAHECTDSVCDCLTEAKERNTTLQIEVSSERSCRQKYHFLYHVSCEVLNEDSENWAIETVSPPGKSEISFYFEAGYMDTGDEPSAHNERQSQDERRNSHIKISKTDLGRNKGWQV